MCTSKFTARSVINNGIFEVHGPEFNVNIDARGCGQIMFDKLNQYSPNILQIYAPTGAKETYCQAKTRAIRVAIALKKRGFKPEDIICICAYNAFDPTILSIACQLIGATMAAIEENIKEAIKEAKLSIEIVVFDNKTEDNLTTPFTDFLKENREEERKFKPQVCKADDVAYIMFSSGTTGPPKGYCLSHHSILHAAECFIATGSDLSTFLQFATYYWISGVLFSLLVILIGAKRILSPRLSVNAFIKAVHDYKVTYCFLPSTIIYKLSEESVCNYDTSNLQALAFGGSPISGEQLKKVRTYFPYTQVTILYGMTEVCGCYHPKNDYSLLNERLTTSGYPAPGIIMRIIDPKTEKALGPNQIGEIRVKCNSPFKSHINANAEDAFDENSFLKSGDIGYFDEENFLFVIDRMKEMFKFRDVHVVPISIEAILYQHPAVDDACVIGIPHEEDGELPAAIVVLKSGVQTTAEDIEKFVEERVNDWHKLRGGVKFVNRLLKTPSNKYARRLMRDKILKNESW